jgi:hypothetical protein
MTRTERLAKQEALAREQLERQRTRLAKVQAKLRAEEQKERTQRYVAVGKMVEDAGLLALSGTDLAALFAVLKTLCDAQNPGAVLEALLYNAPRPTLVPVEGCADLRSCGPCGASGTSVH